jgi:Mn2+/Fe2+ NRAMP family transporter
MFLSNLVMFAIIATCAVILFQNGITNIQTASQAAEALRPFAGKQAFLLFTLGIIGTGMLAVPILAGSASYALSETWKWKFGLYRKFNQAKSFYGVIILSMLLGLILNFVGLDPIKALIYSAVLNGLISPIILILIVQISGNEKIMGNWKNGNITNALGWLITIIMILTAVATLASLLF